ncbi:glycoside hydrolase family 3 protein [Spirillospora albida]|uniref:glycoside hydrolase family 3 protein n=1 Tax=Spirillospora albida TaxID=58123 RepID=UPI0004C04A66|nr:glycoside hydrolase family 3 C-terminal domain-containing protein [Spirillospora albida]
MSVPEDDLRGRVARLTLDEKADLLTGANFWTLRAVPEIGLRRLVLSDGPSGVRGVAWDERAPSLLFPNATSLAATWSVPSAERAGFLNGAQARDKGVHVQLAPTVNLHRTPLGGRHFENYSEDPLLTARIGAGFVRGVQSTGVAATVKHFVGNDSETGRMSYDARISPSVLESVYLRPFAEAVRAGAWAVMAAYNKVNGTSMTENRPLLTEVLKERWGFDGVIVSDWTAIRSTEASANAGMDLEMPGLPSSRWRAKLAAAVREGRVAEELVDDKVLRLLRLAARVGALEGVPEPPPVTTPPDARDQLRGLAAQGMVLLRNEGGVLPLSPGSAIALIGPNAVRFSAQGGGSAHVNPAHVVTPVEGLRRVFGPAFPVHSGVHPHDRLAPLPIGMATDPETGERGVRLEFIDADGALLNSEHRSAAHFIILDGLPPGTAQIVLRANVTPATDGIHTFAAAGVGAHELRIGSLSTTATLTADGLDPVEALMRPPEHRMEAELSAGRTVPVELRHATGGRGAAFSLGYQEPHLPEDEEFAAAVAAARAAETAIVIVGTHDGVESEGFDRTTLALPGRQDALISAVAAANPRTIAVVNAGAPVLMPWRDEVAAILWAWLPGQEGGDAIADVLCGAAEPGGRLPTTFPASESDLLSPVPDADGTLAYAEGADIGHRHYAPDDIAFPFGHGLGYTTWEYTSLKLQDGVAEVTVRNTGTRPGREVVQCYDASRLVGFEAVEAEPGAEATTRISLDGEPRTVRAGRSSADIRLTG